MGVSDSWQHLREFIELAASYPHLQVWLFGSALTSGAPSDIDILLMYKDRADVLALREARWWADCEPPLHIIAMTADEERHYRFIAVTGAERLA